MRQLKQAGTTECIEERTVSLDQKPLPLEVLADVLVYHRMHSSNLTRRRQEDSRREYLGIVKASLDRRRALSEADPCTAVVP